MTFPVPLPYLVICYAVSFTALAFSIIGAVSGKAWVSSIGQCLGVVGLVLSLPMLQFTSLNPAYIR